MNDDDIKDDEENGRRENDSKLTLKERPFDMYTLLKHSPSKSRLHHPHEDTC